MGAKHAGVDAYITKSRSFARPILAHLRRLVHRGCPEVEESLKWGFPHFGYKGMFCAMAAFNQHATFAFWKKGLLRESVTPLGKSTERAMGQFGRLTSLADLPAERTMLMLIKRAAVMNQRGVKNPARTAVARKARPRMPADLKAALEANSRALNSYRHFTPGQQREYVEWITSAKRAETRSRRVATAVSWMARGRTQNWKYERA